MITNHTSVSIIVPVYGTEDYLPACIESLQKQTYPHIEIILVDDQSPDTCPAICDAYAQKDERIRVIHQRNTGVSGARNAGLDAATGDFIAFVDSDDELYPNAVEALIRDVSDYGADVVSALKHAVDKDGNAHCSHEDGEITVYRGEEPLLLSLAGDRNTNSACAKLFKADFIREIRFEVGKNIHEDGFFLFRCYCRKPVLVQHNIGVYRYNTREDSGSRQAFSDKYLAMLYYCDRKKELIAEQYPQYADQLKNMEARTNLLFLQVLCRTADKKYNDLQKQCIRTVRKLKKYHRPINSHLKKLEWIVSLGLFPLYKGVIRRKYHL
jgi:glycosyltransferase involved in cell wall biosynthesis